MYKTVYFQAQNKRNNIEFSVQILKLIAIPSILYSYLTPSVPQIHYNPDQNKVVIKDE